jgi:hypothetical protein
MTFCKAISHAVLQRIARGTIAYTGSLAISAGVSLPGPGDCRPTGDDGDVHGGSRNPDLVVSSGSTCDSSFQKVMPFLPETGVPHEAEDAQQRLALAQIMFTAAHSLGFSVRVSALWAE